MVEYTKVRTPKSKARLTIRKAGSKSIDVLKTLYFEDKDGLKAFLVRNNYPLKKNVLLSSENITAYVKVMETCNFIAELTFLEEMPSAPTFTGYSNIEQIDLSSSIVSREALQEASDLESSATNSSIVTNREA